MITIIATIRLRARETPRRRWKCDADEARCRYKSIMMIIGRALNFCFSRVSSSTSTGGNFASIAHLSIKQGMESVDGWRRVKVMGNLWCWNGVQTSSRFKFKLPPGESLPRNILTRFKLDCLCRREIDDSLMSCRTGLNFPRLRARLLLKFQL